MAHPAEPQPGPEGSPPQPPMMQYYIHPGAAAGYAPYGHHYPPMYPHPPPGHPSPHPTTSHGPVSGAPPPPPNIINEPPPQTVNPADTSKKDDGIQTNGVDGSTVNGKKRSRSGKSGESRSKRAKPSSGSGRNDKESESKGEGVDGM